MQYILTEEEIKEFELNLVKKEFETQLKNISNILDFISGVNMEQIQFGDMFPKELVERINSMAPKKEEAPVES